MKNFTFAFMAYLFPLFGGVSITESIEQSTPYILRDDEEIVIHDGVTITAPMIQLSADELFVEGNLYAPEGKILLLGREITLQDGSTVDVSGTKGAGSIEIGGEQTESIFIEKEAQICADAQKGNAGRIELYSRVATHFKGWASAASINGDAGLIDLSSEGNLYYRGGVDLGSEKGGRGMLLLDPKFVTIDPLGDASATGQTFSSNPSEEVTISGADIATVLQTADLTIQANSDIFVSDLVDATAGVGILSLQAGRSILIQQSILAGSNGVNFTINDQNAVVANRDAGTAQLFISHASVTSEGGNIEAFVGTFGGTQIGEFFSSYAQIDAKGGDVTFPGFSTDNVGIRLSSSNIATSGSGNIQLNGNGGTGSNDCHGLHINNSMLTAEDGTIQVTGVSNGTGEKNNGVVLKRSHLTATGSGDVTVSGTGGPGTTSNLGILVENYGLPSAIQTQTGNITLTGTTRAAQDRNSAVRILGAILESTGSGNLSINGTVQSGDHCNVGTYLTNAQLRVASGGISITGNGNGSGNLNQGIRIENGVISSTLTGSSTPLIDLTGVGSSAGTLNNEGVVLSGKKATITSIDANIDIDGTGGGGSEGVLIQNPNLVYTTGTGTVTIISGP